MWRFVWCYCNVPVVVDYHMPILGLCWMEAVYFHQPNLGLCPSGGLIFLAQPPSESSLLARVHPPMEKPCRRAQTTQSIALRYW